jgi:hypothetical protein
MQQAYSFAVTLREVLPCFYMMCDVVSQSLKAQGVLGEGEEDAAPRHTRRERPAETFEMLNKLPVNGFPDEIGRRVHLLHLQDGAVVARTAPVRRLVGDQRMSSEIPYAAPGRSYKLLYYGMGPDDYKKNRSRS